MEFGVQRRVSEVGVLLLQRKSMFKRFCEQRRTGGRRLCLISEFGVLDSSTCGVELLISTEIVESPSPFTIRSSSLGFADH